MTPNPYPIALSNRRLTILAWITTILISTMPDILFDLFSGGVPGWLVYAKMGLLGLMIALAVFWKTLRPLLRFLIIMVCFFGMMELRTRLDFTWPALQKLFGQNVFDSRMQAEQTGKLAISLLIIGLLLIMGYKFRDIFLKCGDLKAPMEPVKLLGFPKVEPWPKFALIYGFGIAGFLAVLQFFSLRPSGEVLCQVVPILPSILFYAALNAFNEEYTFRAPMLATLEPIGGSKHALWMAAFFFGIAHYFGTPGGIIGGLLSIFMGWILGKAMVETRGGFWAWWIHFLSDVAIFIFLTTTLIK
jgi:hypothetical protein